MKKIISVLLSFFIIFVFASCSSDTNKGEKLLKNKINISYLDSKDEKTVYALDIFSRKIDELSESLISVDYNVSENPIEDLNIGKAQIIVTDTKSLEEYGDNFKILTSPFFFLSPMQSTMLLNSSDFRELYDDYFKSKLNCEVLGTVYLEGEYIFSLKEAFTNFREDETNAIFAVDGKDHALMEILDANEILCTTYEKATDIKEDLNLVYIDSVDLKQDFLSGKNKVYISEYPYRINSQWVLVSKNYWDTLDQKQKNIIKQALSFFNSAAEDERLKEYENLYYTLSKRNINMVEAYSAEIRNYCHSFVKYSSNVYGNIDASLFNKTVNIIIS